MQPKLVPGDPGETITLYLISRRRLYCCLYILGIFFRHFETKLPKTHVLYQSSILIRKRNVSIWNAYTCNMILPLKCAFSVCRLLEMDSFAEHNLSRGYMYKHRIV